MLDRDTTLFYTLLHYLLHYKDSHTIGFCEIVNVFDSNKITVIEKSYCWLLKIEINQHFYRKETNKTKRRKQ